MGTDPRPKRVAIAIANGQRGRNLADERHHARHHQRRTCAPCIRSSGVNRQTQLAKLLLTGRFGCSFEASGQYGIARLCRKSPLRTAQCSPPRHCSDERYASKKQSVGLWFRHRHY